MPRTELWVLRYAQVLQADGASRRNVLLGRARAEPLSWPGADQPHGDELLLLADARFDQQTVAGRLAALGLPSEASLSVLAVELLPEPRVERYRDPLGADLGQVRVLRTPPLQAAPPIC